MESSPFLQAASYRTAEDSVPPRASFGPIQPAASSAAAMMLMRYNINQRQHPVAAHQDTHYGDSTDLVPLHHHQAAASSKTAAPSSSVETEIAHAAYHLGGFADTRQDLHYSVDPQRPGRHVSFHSASQAQATLTSVNPHFDLEQIRHHHATPTLSRYFPVQAPATVGVGTVQSRETFGSADPHFHHFHSLYYGQPEEQFDPMTAVAEQHAAQTMFAPLVTSTPPLLPSFPFGECLNVVSPTFDYNQQQDIRGSEQYEYKQLKDGSKMTRYVDAGIASEWIPVDQSRSQWGS